MIGEPGRLVSPSNSAPLSLYTRFVVWLSSEEDVVSLRPDIQFTVEDRENLPVGYDVHSLIDAGCTPAEAVDYIMCGLRGEYPLSWARTRGVTKETVKENITTVEDLFNG